MIFLAGDAAHVHSPAGGQGMNTGLQDALELAHALALALRHGDTAGIDAYPGHRRAIAKRIVELTDRMTRAATLQSSLGKHVRNAVVSLLGHLPPVQHAIATNLAELNNR
jgi:2-polyprenyl-6-methoxyphenol hydroxylase-like FAD-dependent oxidoreductase